MIMAEEKNIPQASGTENQKVVMNFGGADIEATIDKDGRIVLPNEIQQMLAAGATVMQQASQGATQEVIVDKPQEGETVLKDNVADKFRGLPMRDLIGGPLFAAAEAEYVDANGNPIAISDDADSYEGDVIVKRKQEN